MTDSGTEQPTRGPVRDHQSHGDAVLTAPAKPAFAHQSEAEMARILDFYAVTWDYEPHRFPILWNLEGTVVESFSPDFYLPDLDLYLEMTTLRQRLVRKKNRKLRRLRELYPDVRIKLFYARDFRQLMLKYGKLALVDALSGTPGQVGPIRVEPALLVEVTDESTLPEPAVPARLEPGSTAPVPVVPASRTARRARDEGPRRPARRPARPERPGSGR